MKKLVLFDIDKTLINSLKGRNKVFSEAIRNIYGVKSDIRNINHHGMTDQQIITEMLKREGFSEKYIKHGIKDCMDMMVEMFRKNISEGDIVLLPGVKRLLEELSRKDVLIGLVTGNVKEVALQKLKMTGIAHYFRIGGFGDEGISRQKLISNAIRKAKEKFNFRAKGNIFLFGDSPSDIKAGKESGITTIGLKTGIYGDTELRKLNPNYILDDLTDYGHIINDIIV